VARQEFTTGCKRPDRRGLARFVTSSADLIDTPNMSLSVMR
jgi:hypothetical protein